MELICKTQNYAWGVKGYSSSVAQLTKAACPEFEINENVPYAELWMGTHPNGPSVIKESGKLLSTYIEENPQCLGSKITEKFGNNLCYLFKVLSVNQALSIQAHPEKSHAEQLNKERPDIYKDPNHKPEMAIALTPFQALCGFRPKDEIIQFLKEIEELRRVIGEEDAAAFAINPSENNLKKCYANLMTSSKEKVSAALEDLKKRITLLEDEKMSIKVLKDLFLTLCNKYPGDVGCFSIYFLNYIVLEPGEAMYLGANVIHAYLLGDCIECMSCSDNTIRAGLTPKFIDVDTLLDMLEYKMLPAESRKFEGSKVNEFTTLFNPPVPDFAVQTIEAKNEQKVSLTMECSASILIVIKGTGTELTSSPARSNESFNSIGRGSVLFIEAEQTVSFSCSDQFLAFRALCV